MLGFSSININRFKKSTVYLSFSFINWNKTYQNLQTAILRGVAHPSQPGGRHTNHRRHRLVRVHLRRHWRRWRHQQWRGVDGLGWRGRWPRVCGWGAAEHLGRRGSEKKERGYERSRRMKVEISCSVSEDLFLWNRKKY